MARYTARDASARIFVWREGLAAAVGHDLELRVGELELDVAPDRVEGAFVASSLAVVGAVKDGVTDEAAFSKSDRATIERAVRETILDAGRFPVVRFRSTRVDVAGGTARVEGVLSLRGVERPLAFDVAVDGRRATADVVVDQPAFGIAPYTAFFGALKVKPHVLVRVTVPYAPP